MRPKGEPYENGRVIFPPAWARQDCGVADPIEDETPMQDITWREIRTESGRLFAFIMLGLSLLALVYLLGWR